MFTLLFFPSPNAFSWKKNAVSKQPNDVFLFADWSSPSCPPSTPTCTRPSRTARTATKSSAKQLILQTRNLLITFANRGLDQNGTRKNITTAMEKWGQLHPSPTTLLLLLLPLHRKLDLLT